MIAMNFITDWKHTAPWASDLQVEQDLIISRALVEMFQNDDIRKSLAFRGGTALYKLFITPPARYSEDIDLVQVTGGPIGSTLDRIRGVLDPWLGTPKRDLKRGRVTLYYRFIAEGADQIPLKLKIEINSEEHFTVHGFEHQEYSVDSPWFSGKASIQTYRVEELLGTKLRALYQRKKSRDLFDLWKAIESIDLDEDLVLKSFAHYLGQEKRKVSRAEFEANMAQKMCDPKFLADISPLLAHGSQWDIKTAERVVQNKLICKLPGEPWKG